MKDNRHSLVAAIALSAMLGALSVAGPTTSTFDSDLDGWTGLSADLTFQELGGNGMLLAVDNGSPAFMTVIAPQPFRGNLHGYSGGTLYFDATMFLNGDPQPCLDQYGVITIRGANNVVLSYDMADLCPPVEGWQRFSAPLTAEAWGVGDVLFNEVMADVLIIMVQVEGQTSDSEKQAIDNFTLTDCPWDINTDGATDFSDLVAMLANWGPCDHCMADIDGDGGASFGDLVSMLNWWGGCP